MEEQLLLRIDSFCTDHLDLLQPQPSWSAQWLSSTPAIATDLMDNLGCEMDMLAQIAFTVLVHTKEIGKSLQGGWKANRWLGH